MKTGLDGLLENMRGEIKARIKADIRTQFVLTSVVGLLAAAAPELITPLAEKAIESVRHAYYTSGQIDGFIDEDIDAIFSEAQIEMMQTFEKMQTMILK